MIATCRLKEIENNWESELLPTTVKLHIRFVVRLVGVVLWDGGQRACGWLRCARSVAAPEPSRIAPSRCRWQQGIGVRPTAMQSAMRRFPRLVRFGV